MRAAPGSDRRPRPHDSSGSSLNRRIAEAAASLVELEGGQASLLHVYGEGLGRGEPDDEIPEILSERKFDLIVMGTIGRSGVSGLFIGNTAEHVLAKADCSVPALKPDDFESPVR